MSKRKRPVFGTISLVLMLGLAAAGIAIMIFEPPPPPISDGENVAVALEAVATVIAMLLTILSVSFCSAIFALIGLIRREPAWPAAIGLALALPALIVVILTIPTL